MAHSAGGSGDDASAAAPAGAQKVIGFLRQIQGLNAFGCADLEGLLYRCRFELLPPPKSGEGGGGDGQRLPRYSDVPTQRELHELLLGGQVPNGHQRVAHVLYPETVPWPAKEGGLDDTQPEQAPQGTPEKQGDLKDGLRQPTSSPKAQSRGSRARRSEIDGPRLAVAGSAGAMTPRSSDAPRDEADRRKSELLGSSGGVDSVVEENRGEVIICGQKITTSVRGRPVLEPPEDLLAVALARPKDDEKYNAARDRRIKLERQVQLEQYQEKKLVERVQAVEGMRQSEEQHQEQLEEREARRLARREELKKQLEEDNRRKMEEEKAAAAVEAKRKEEEAAVERRRSGYHQKQKEALGQWYSEQAEDSAFAEEGARQRREQLLAQEAQARQAREQSRLRTLREAEADARVQRMQEAVEERPPLAPKPHDRPAPVLSLLDDPLGRPQKQAAARPRPASWTGRAKAVSNMYGLTEREHADMEGHLLRGVRGAGRMAGYER